MTGLRTQWAGDGDVMALSHCTAAAHTCCAAVSAAVGLPAAVNPTSLFTRILSHHSALRSSHGSSLTTQPLFTLILSHHSASLHTDPLSPLSLVPLAHTSPSPVVVVVVSSP
jgi:hypothetical protein